MGGQRRDVEGFFTVVVVVVVVVVDVVVEGGEELAGFGSPGAGGRGRRGCWCCYGRIR